MVHIILAADHTKLGRVFFGGVALLDVALDVVHGVVAGASWGEARHTIEARAPGAERG